METRRVAVGALAAVALGAVGYGIAVQADRDGPPRAAPRTRSGVRAAKVVVEEAAPSLRVTTRVVSGLGRVLANGDGRTLYAFLPDGRGRVTCLRACQAYWVPAKLAPGQPSALAAGGARRGLLGSVASPDGGRVATYGGRALYTFMGDSHGGLAKGQGALLPEPCSFLNLDCSQVYGGAVSYTLTPAGTLDRRHAGADANGP